MLNFFNWIFPRKDSKDERDYMFLTRPENGIQIPVAEDLHVLPFVNQGDLGSCVGCAGAHIMSHYFGKRMSALWLYYQCEQIDNHPEQGTDIRCALKVLKEKGICLEDSWPYSDKWPLDKPGASLDEEASKYRIGSYYRATTLKQVVRAVSARLPVFATIKIFSGWFNGKTTVDDSGFPLGIHAIAYSACDIPRGRFIITNSWGDRWKSAGRAYVPFEYFKKYKVDNWVPVIERKE